MSHPPLRATLVALSILLGASVSAAAQTTNLRISTDPDHNVGITSNIHPTGPGANLNAQTLIGLLQAANGLPGSGYQVILTTFPTDGAPDSGEPGDITLDAAISFTNNQLRELFFLARGGVTVHQPITPAGQTRVTLVAPAAGGTIHVEAPIVAGAGDVGITVNAAQDIVINGALSVSGNADIQINSQGNQSGVGTLAILQPLSVQGTGTGSILVFAEDTLVVAAPLTVGHGYLSISSDLGALEIANGSALASTGNSLRSPSTNGEQVIFYTGGDIKVGDRAAPGGPVTITTTDGLLQLRAGGDLRLAHAQVSAGARLDAVAGGDVIVDGVVSAGSGAATPVSVRAGHGFLLGATGSFQVLGGATGTLILDDRNPHRPNLDPTAQLVLDGPFDLGPGGAIFAASPAATQLNGYHPSTVRYNVWFGEQAAGTGLNFKALDPNRPPVIPTLSPFGLGALILLLAFASLRLLRRRGA